MSYQPGIDTELLRTFVAIAEHGGFTRAAEAVNRTQSAVSMQMKRLEEDVLQRSLFERDGRQTRLTAEGQVLLGYARRILKLHGEVFNTLRQPHMVGSVRIGTPDDYVMRFLPAILSRFAEAYPLVQVEVHCDTSLNLLARNDLDLSIVTREPGTEIGQLLRQEPFVWMAAEGFCPHHQRPIPPGHVQHHLFLPRLGLQRPWKRPSWTTASPTAARACRRCSRWSAPAWR
ncbi:LysR family transcriptional regulator [Pseudomonas aeruginosa]|nr:LysR family transcriptional regulator [Pseudomonas aeruginosa]